MLIFLNFILHLFSSFLNILQQVSIWKLVGAKGSHIDWSLKWAEPRRAAETLAGPA